MRYFTPHEYILLEIAGQFGLDKATWDTRLAWTRENEDKLESLLPEAKEPEQYISAVMEYRKVQAGEPTGMMVAFDATASGQQLLACMTGCVSTATHTNLINTFERKCPYTFLRDMMVKAGSSASLTVAQLKAAAMPFFYGSRAEPENVFGEGEELMRFYTSLQQHFPGPFEAMNVMLSVIDPERSNYSWTLPDGHTVDYNTMAPKDIKLESDECGVKITYRTLEEGPIKGDKSLAANITHSVDAYVVRELGLRCQAEGIEVLHIFDDFRASPLNMNRVRELYLQILTEIASMDLLGNILRQITGVNQGWTKIANNLPELMQDGDYLLS